MKGFGAFREHTEIDFTDVDLLALIGPTGSGKSTVIDAITFALYGSVARYEDNRAVAPAINGTSNEARVALTFELGGASYVAVRVVRRTKTGATTKEARLERGSEVLASDARSMSEAVEEVLGLDVDQFNRTVVLPQGRFADFLHDKPSDRQATLRQLLGLGMYERIGRLARQRAARFGDQADVLRGEAEESEGELSDDRRLELVASLAGIIEVRQGFETTRGQLSVAAAELDEVRAAVDAAKRSVELLETVVMPEGIDELSTELRTADEVRAATSAELLTAKKARTKAAAAVAEGPDLSTLAVQLGMLDTIDTLAGRHEDLVLELQAAQKSAAESRALVDGFGETQTALDLQVEEARSAENAARLAVAGQPALGQIDAWLNIHRLHSDATRRVTDAEKALAVSSKVIGPLESAADEKAAELDQARQEAEELKTRAGVVAHADLLVVGEPCPLCLQDVAHLPEHHVDDAELRAAKTRVKRSETEAIQAKAAFEQATAAMLQAETKRDAALETLAQIDNELIGIDSPAALATLRAEIVELEETVKSATDATRAAVESAKAHKASPEYRYAITAASEADDLANTLAGSEKATAQQLEASRADAAALPDRENLSEQQTTAIGLKEDLASAQKALEEAEDADEQAAATLEQAKQRLTEANNQLAAVRERVAGLEPPANPGDDILTNWTALKDWATRQHEIALTQRNEATERYEIIATRQAQLEDGLRAKLAGIVEEHEHLAVEEIGLKLAGIEATAQAAIEEFDQRRTRLGELRDRIENLDEQATVATMLGHLLRSSGFEGWLMKAALDTLVERATGRLLELSGGQYSLEVGDGRAFAVRDHTNADELRNARTLSGGETFLASLALALALAEATSEMATEGAPPMESMFLDEGFGTLDPDALDVVATAIEELGATGRMVGIVTHIRELADRMPVRLEVTKTAGSASVERVEV